MIKKYKKGDEVIVRVGKDKGKIGKISKIINSADKVVISGVNVSKKHQKPSQAVSYTHLTLPTILLV